MLEEASASFLEPFNHLYGGLQAIGLFPIFGCRIYYISISFFQAPGLLLLPEPSCEPMRSIGALASPRYSACSAVRCPDFST